MLLRSTSLRFLLALIIAAWPSVCLCHAGEVAGQSDSGCCESHDGDEPEGHGGTHGCPPGHHERGPGCNCQQVAAPMVKADSVHFDSLSLVCPFAYAVPGDWCGVPTHPTRCGRNFRPPGPAMTLLRLHCALIV